MNFHELRIIIGNIKKEMRCPVCNGKYSDEDIDVVGGACSNESFFHIYCSRCNDGSCIHVDMHSEMQPPLNLSIKGEVRLGSAPRMQRISTNEVLDMRNFLKKFSGDFSSEFQEENKNA